MPTPINDYTDCVIFNKKEDTAVAFRCPEGWLLVPIEPNVVMVDAGNAEIDPGYCEESSSSRFVEDGESIAIYKAMLSTAPEYKP